MTTPPIPDDIIAERVDAYLAADKNQSAAAKALGIARETLQRSLRHAASKGLLGTAPVLPGFRISQTTSTPHAPGAIATATASRRFCGPSGAKAETGRMATAITTGLLGRSTVCKKNAVSSAVSVPWVMTTACTSSLAKW